MAIIRWFKSLFLSGTDRLCCDCHFAQFKGHEGQEHRDYYYFCMHPKNLRTSKPDRITGHVRNSVEHKRTTSYMRGYTYSIFGLSSCGSNGRWFRRK